MWNCAPEGRVPYLDSAPWRFCGEELDGRFLERADVSAL